MTYGAVHGKFLDHADFAPVLARAETLGVPIYIHPNRASPEAMEVYYSGLGDKLVSFALSGPGYGWHQEVALQCLRMIVSGVFDRHPKLQIVIGHMARACRSSTGASGRPGAGHRGPAAETGSAVFPRQFLDHDQRVFPRRAAAAGAVGDGRGPGDVRGGLSVREQQ